MIYLEIMLTKVGTLFSYSERQKSCTTYSFDFFWIKIDDFKNQRSLVFMPAQKAIVAEKIKCVGNHAYIFGRKM